MSCLAISSGYTYTGCKDNISGVDEIIVTEYNNLDQTNPSNYATTSNVVTTLVLASTKQGWKYDLGKEMVSASDNATINTESDTVFYTPQITFTTKGFTTLTKVNLDTLSRHRLLIFVKRRNGTWWLAGLDGGMDAKTIENPFGQKYEDFSGHIANFSGKSESPMIEVNAALITALLSPAP